MSVKNNNFDNHFCFKFVKTNLSNIPHIGDTLIIQRNSPGLSPVMSHVYTCYFVESPLIATKHIYVPAILMDLDRGIPVRCREALVRATSTKVSLSRIWNTIFIKVIIIIEILSCFIIHYYPNSYWKYNKKRPRWLPFKHWSRININWSRDCNDLNYVLNILFRSKFHAFSGIIASFRDFERKI